MRKSPLLIVFLTVTIDLIGFGMVIPLLPLYAEKFGASATLVALLFASYSLMQFLFAPMWGRLSDRVGRRPVLLVSILGNMLALLLFGLAQSFWWLLAARVLAGFCTANLSVANAYIADVTRPEERAKGMGVVGAAFGIGFVLGPFVGGELSVWGYAAPAFAAAALAALNFVGALLLLPESLPPERRVARVAQGFVQRWQQVRRIDGVGALLALGFLQVFAFSMLEMAFVLFANRRLDFDVRECGRVFAFIGVMMVVVQGGLIGRLVARFGETRLVVVGLACLSAGLLLIPTTPAGAWPLLLVFVSIMAVGQGLVSPTLSGLLSRRAPSTMQGLTLGVAQSMSSLARVTGPQLAGLMFDGYGENAPFLVGGVLLALACGAAAMGLRRVTALPATNPAPGV